MPNFWQRRRSMPAPLERRIHIAVADRLRAECQPHWWWSHIGHGEKRSAETAALLQRMGLKPGLFDFLLISPAGVHHWLELKRDHHAAVTAGQEDFTAMLRERGVPFRIARSYDAAIEQLQQWGAL